MRRLPVAALAGGVLLATGAGSLPAPAADWFVSSREGPGASARGSDANGRKFVESQFEHIQKAADAARPGRQSDRLYLRTPDGSPPGAHVVEVKQRDWAFDPDGKAHITVRGFGLFGASVTTDRRPATAGTARAASRPRTTSCSTA